MKLHVFSLNWKPSPNFIPSRTSAGKLSILSLLSAEEAYKFFLSYFNDADGNDAMCIAVLRDRPKPYEWKIRFNVTITTKTIQKLPYMLHRREHN